MTLHDTDIVARFAHRLREQIGGQRFELWFQSGVAVSVTGCSVRIVAATSFTHGRLLKHFRGDLETAARDLLGPAAQIEIDQQPQAASARLLNLDGPPDGPPAASSSTTEATSPPTAASAAAKVAPATPLPPAPADERAASTSASPAVRPVHTLAEFVVGPGHQLAFASVQRMLRQSDGPSPVLLYGPPGVGKTHLLEAAALAARAAGKRMVLRLSAEEFTTQFVAAVQGSGLPNFRRKVRHADLLIIDDLQFLENKKATVGELAYSLDTLHRARKQVLLSADRHPSELAFLGAEFAARLSGGLNCPIGEADASTRAQIVRRMAERAECPLTDEVVTYLAEVLPGDARQLRGAVHRLAAHCEVLKTPITGDLARTIAADLVRPPAPLVRLADVEQAVCEVFGVEGRDLRSENKSRPMKYPRMLAMWLARKYTRAGLSEIGRHFGRRSHSTVISAQRSVDGWLTSGEEIALGGLSCRVSDALRRVESRFRTA